MYGAAQKYLRALNNPLSTLFAAESGYYSHDEDSSADSSDTDLDSDSDSDSTGSSDSSDSEISETTVIRLGELTPSPFESDISMPRVNHRVATVLDHLKDGGSNLTHLALSLDLEVQWVRDYAPVACFS